MSGMSPLSKWFRLAWVGVLTWLVCVGCSSSIRRQERDLSALLTGHNIGRLVIAGVVDIPEKGRQPSFNPKLSDMAVSHFVSLDSFRYVVVVRRPQEIELVARDLGINLWDITDREKAKTVGEKLGVDAIVLGKHYVTRQQMGAPSTKGDKVIFQIVDVATGQLVWSETTSLTE